MPQDYETYKQEISADIRASLAEASCQPILFIGSGFTQRYANGPSWEGLLKLLADECDSIDKDFPYYKQTHNSPIKIGSIFTDLYQQWAWGEGRHVFPPSYFSDPYPKEIFVKHMASQLLSRVGPSANGSYGSDVNDAEIAALKAINPHVIITTNFDQLLEPLFSDYQPVIGQEILGKSFLSIGEIFKIHGCVSRPLSLILNSQDYENFDKDHKYVSAKLLTYFAEHPVLFIGYGAEDPNIRNVLYDVHRMLRHKFELIPNSDLEPIPNIFLLEWDAGITPYSNPPREKVLSVADANIRIKSIKASSFEWVFKAFGTAGTLDKVNMKLLRALMARTINLIRSDIPKKTVEIDFQMLESAVETDDSFAKLFGIASTADPSQVNLTYRYTLTEVAQQLGFSYWSPGKKLIDTLESLSGFGMQSSDNPYHVKLKTGMGSKSVTHKYSEAAVELLRKVLVGEDYNLLISPSTVVVSVADPALHLSATTSEQNQQEAEMEAPTSVEAGE